MLQRQRREHIGKLFAAIDQLSADAEARGLTDENLEEELPAYNTERRN